MVMYKVKTTIIALLISITLQGQNRNNTISIVNTLVDDRLLQLLFTNNLGGVLELCESDDEFVCTHNFYDESRLLKDIWKLNITHTNYNIQTIVYSENHDAKKSEFSKIYIEFESSFQAERFLRYFCPLAKFNGPGVDGRYYRMMQTAEILEDYNNVVFFWLTYPAFEFSD